MDQAGTYKWVQDRLKDLYNGTLSDEDRLRMLDIAKTDPFVADALEGYEAHAHHDHTIQLNNISHRIRARKNRHRRILMPSSRGWILQAAAACLVLLIATWAVMQFTGTSRNDALVTKTEIPPPPVAGESAADGQDENETRTGNASAEPVEESPSGLRATAQADADKYLKQNEASTSSSADKNISTTNAEVKEKETYTFSEPAPAAETRREDSVDDDITSPATAVLSDHETQMSPAAVDEGHYANQISPEMMSRRVAGKVTDVNGTPLTGANLSVRNTNIGTFSDIGGKFELYLPSPQSDIDVTYSGFVDASLTLKQGEEDVVIILPDKPMASQEVVKLNTASKTLAENVPAGQVYTATRTEISPSAYSEYLRQNSRLPLQENMAIPGKEVIVEFDVDVKGRPGNLRVIKSAGKDLDDEAARLIRRGPGWKCELDLYPCTAQYTVYFR